MVETVFRNPGYELRGKRGKESDLHFTGEHVERDVALRDKIPHGVVFGVIYRKLKRPTGSGPEHMFEYLLQYRPLERRPDGSVKIYPHTLTVTVGGVDPRVSSSAYDTIKREAREELGMHVTSPLVHPLKVEGGRLVYIGRINPKHSHFVGAICSARWRGNVVGVKTKVNQHKQTRFYKWPEIKAMLLQQEEDAPEY